MTLPPVSEGGVPALPDWPMDLPLPERVEGGTLLPSPLDDAIHIRLLWLDAYPDLCRFAMERQADYYKAELDEVAASQPSDWRTTVLAAAAGVVVGALASAVLVAAVR